jgi:hypothetical protein
LQVENSGFGFRDFGFWIAGFRLRVSADLGAVQCSEFRAGQGRIGQGRVEQIRVGW